MQLIENIFQKQIMLRERNDPRFTVAFDMDNTLFDEKGKRIRPGIENALEFLSKMKIKMVVWTNATKDWADGNFKKNNISKYFYGLITRESYALDTIKKNNPIFYEKIIAGFPKEKVFQDKFDTGKNLSLLGYDILVDDNPRVQQEAAFWGGAYEVMVCESFRSTGGLNKPAQIEQFAKVIAKRAKPGLLSMFSRR